MSNLDGLTAEAISERMAERYAGCHSYRDTGWVITRFLTPEGELQSVSRKPFCTAFIRPDRFRFEFKSHHPHRTEWFRYVISAEGGAVRTWWDIGEELRTPESLALALAGATGVSSGSAHTVPRMLLPDKTFGLRLIDLVELRRLEDALLRDVECCRVQGRLVPYPSNDEELEKTAAVTGRIPERGEHDPRILWIDKSSFLLRMIEEATRFVTFQTEKVCVYEPEIDAAIAEEELKFHLPGGRL